MKRATLSIRLDFKSPVGLAEQIVRYVSDKILAGNLQEGTVLPSVRSLAETLQISPDTVVSAYRELSEQGFLKAKRGSGFTIVKNESVLLKQRNSETQKEEVVEKIELSERALFAEEIASYFNRKNYTNRPFVVYSSGLAKMLSNEWTRQASVVARSPWNHTDYSDPAGFLPLRRAIASRLLQNRGIRCSAENIIITNGTVQNLNLIFKVLFQAGDTLAMESPAASVFSQIAFFSGLNVHHIPVSEKGITKEQIAGLREDVKGIFVSPANQTPLSVTMNEECRSSLLRRALKTKSWILEADIENVVWFNSSPLMPLRAEPGAEHRVVYMDSFTLQFYPGIKIGYLVVPDGYAKAFAGAKLMTDRSSSEQNQAILANYLNSPSYDHHLRKLRKRFKESFLYLRENLNTYLSEYGHMSDTLCGSHIAFHLHGISDAVAAARLNEKGIVVRPLSAFEGKGSKMNGFMMGFGTFTEEEIKGAVLKIKSVLEEVSREEPKFSY